ncbi:MAG: hypothetical protein ACLUFN_10570 [Eubacterium sp.]
MDLSDFKISKAQAKEIALTIFADISNYIETNRQEYDEFLKNLDD